MYLKPYSFPIYFRTANLFTILDIKAFTIINVNPQTDSKIAVPTANDRNGVFSIFAIETKKGRSKEINATV